MHVWVRRGLVVGIPVLSGLYVFTPVSHTIDLVRIELRTGSSYVEGKTVGLVYAGALKKTHKDEAGFLAQTDSYGVADFHYMPQGSYEVYVHGYDCRLSKTKNVAEFTFTEPFRFRRPVAYRLVVNPEKCLRVGYNDKLEFTWKWGW